jgi:hypothetical protein
MPGSEGQRPPFATSKAKHPLAKRQAQPVRGALVAQPGTEEEGGACHLWQACGLPAIAGRVTVGDS